MDRSSDERDEGYQCEHSGENVRNLYRTSHLDLLSGIS
jgi:hypothetical protein